MKYSIKYTALAVLVTASAYGQTESENTRRHELSVNTGLNLVELVNGLGESEPGAFTTDMSETPISLGLGYSFQFSPAVAIKVDGSYDKVAGINNVESYTVAAHQAEIVAVSGQVFPGNIASFSSRGPTYDERIKPDVSAPGMNIISSINSYTTRSYTTAASTMFKGRTYDFAAFSGTSMSSPATAGVVALLLEASPTLEPRQVKEILIATAREDNRTGTLPIAGNTVWGHGKVTTTAAVKMALLTVSLDENELNEIRVSLFPNPNKGSFNLQFDKEQQINSLFITDINGRLIKEITPQKTLNYEINFEGASGIYFLNMMSENEKITLKLIKE